MYENYTYEYILDEILKRISSVDQTIDTREGSPLWYAISPVAAELAIAYTNYDRVHKESFVGTASREGIYGACNDIGLDTVQFDASSGIFTAHFDVPISIGSRWVKDGFIFRAYANNGLVEIEGKTYYQYMMVCETVGAESQVVNGTLQPITDYGSDAFKVAVLDECTDPGKDETPDETVRRAYFNYVSNKAEDGNLDQYHQWLNEFDGVGAHRLTPLWNGVCTLRVAILNEDKEEPSDDLVSAVQTFLDPNKQGLGEGVAPIGCKVTVVKGVEVPIYVKASVTLTSPSADITDVNIKLREYFRRIAFQRSSVNYFDVASAILSSPVVNSISGLQIGKSASSYGTDDIALSDIEAPVLGAFSNE